MPNATNDGIPTFLIISQEERRKAWEDFRAKPKPATPEPKPYRPITGDAPDDDPHA